MWAWKQRHQPHIWRLIPRTGSEETITIQLKVKMCKNAASLYLKYYFWGSKINWNLFWCRQEKEAWIRAKYVEKKFLKKLGSTEALVNGERKSERQWSVKKCRRHNSATTVPKTQRRYRQEPGSTSPSALSIGKSNNPVVFICNHYRI